MNNLNLETDKISKLFFAYAIPSIITVGVFSLYSFVDIMFVAKNCSNGALAAVEMCSPVLMLFSCLSVIVGMGSNTLIGISFGIKNSKSASEIFSLSLVICIILGIAFVLLTVLFTNSLAKFLGSNADTLPYMKEYLIVCGVFSPFYIISGLCSECAATVGKPLLSMLGNLSTAILNIILDYLFIVIFKWSVFGAALASGISAAVGCLILFLALIQKNCPLKFCRFSIDWRVIWQILYNGSSEGITVAGGGIISFLYNVIIMKNGGAETLASFTVSLAIINFIGSLLTGAAQGLNPIISTNYGAKNNARIRKTVIVFLMYETLLGIMMSIILIFFKNSFINMFDSAQTDISAHIINAYIPLLILTPCCSVIISFFTSINDAKTSAILSLARTVVIRIIIILLVYFILGINGLWYSAAISEIIAFLICIGTFKQKIKSLI